MKVLLINTPYVDIYGPIKVAVGRFFPLGLGYIASVLRQNGYKVIILDPELENLTYVEIEERIEDITPDLVGISCSTPNFYYALKLAKIVKNKFDIPIVLGGIHASALPELILKRYPDFNYIVIGEGEYTMLELCNTIRDKSTNLKDIKGIAYRDDSTIKVNEYRPFISDINCFPYPARDAVDLSRYWSQSFGARRRQNATMISSRGCPFHCVFCASHLTMGRVYRVHSPEYVLGEIELLIKDYKVRQVIFEDDAFTLSRERTEKICNLIIKKNIKVEWSCFTQINTVDKSLLSLMKRAGCYNVSFGVESADEQILNNINKTIDLKYCKEIIKACNDLGLKTHAFFIFGNEGDTTFTIRKTIDFAIRLKPTLAFFNIMVPYPGTEIYQKLFSQGLLEIENWQDFVAIGLNPVVALGNLTKKDLQKFAYEANIRFYSNCGQLFRILRHIGSWYEFYRYIEGAWGLFQQIRGWRRKGRGDNHN